MQWFESLWTLAGHVSTAAVIFSLLAGGYYCARGFVPVLIRLGNGLWKRKIAIFAHGDDATNLERMLRDSKLFNSSNIVCVRGAGEVESAASASVFLVYWPHCSAYLDTILAKKRETTALIVYAPQSQGPVPPEVMRRLELLKNVVVNNFRGRLLNDLVVSMITSGYEKRRN